MATPRLNLVSLVVCVAACGTTPAPEAKRPQTPAQAKTEPALAPMPATDASASTEEQAAADDSLTHELPSTCSGTDGCYPDAAFTERVCRGKFPDLPLAFFKKGAPWQRLYVKAETVEPVNAYGGPRSEMWMNFGEEVVVLRKRGPGAAKGVHMSGPTDLDVLRWDGTCATIREEMFVKYIPGDMTSPRIVWKYLDDPLQDGLLKNVAVERAQATERKQCRDSSPSQPTPACDKAMRKLTDAIVIAVRLGIELPPAQSGPAWQRAEPTASR
jgi:hypothetical protein